MIVAPHEHVPPFSSHTLIYVNIFNVSFNLKLVSNSACQSATSDFRCGRLCQAGLARGYHAIMSVSEDVHVFLSP